MIDIDGGCDVSGCKRPGAQSTPIPTDEWIRATGRRDIPPTIDRWVCAWHANRKLVDDGAYIREVRS